MISLHQLANPDFILFDAAQTVAQTVAVVQRLKPTRIVVRRRDNGSVYHYLYAVQVFCDRLAQVDGEQSLADALALHEGDATPTLDAWQDAESAPSRCVITEGDRLLGFYDAALPPAWDIKRGGATESTSTALVSRALQAEFPERVPLGQAIQEGRVVDIDADLALSAAKLSWDLKLPMADSLILATVRVHGATLWTQDDDFAGMPGVRYIPKPKE